MRRGPKIKFDCIFSSGSVDVFLGEYRLNKKWNTDEITIAVAEKYKLWCDSTDVSRYGALTCDWKKAKSNVVRIIIYAELR